MSTSKPVTRALLDDPPKKELHQKLQPSLNEGFIDDLLEYLSIGIRSAKEPMESFDRRSFVPHGQPERFVTVRSHTSYRYVGILQVFRKVTFIQQHKQQAISERLVFWKLELVWSITDDGWEPENEKSRNPWIHWHKPNTYHNEPYEEGF
jgi:hypothetical protein